MMATQPLLPEQQCPAPPVPTVRHSKDGPGSDDGCSGLCRWSMGDLSREPTRCQHPGKQNQPAGSRSHPAPQKHSTPQTPSLLPSEGHRGPGAPSGCMRAFGPETRAPPDPSHSKRPPQNTSVPLCPPLCSAVCFLLGVTLKAM